MHKTPRQAITSIACSFGFLYLAGEISKRQPFQFAMQECYHLHGFSLLPMS